MSKYYVKLEISAEDFSTSLERFKEPNGLPKTIQEGATSFQRLVVAKGNINASKEMFFAMNNAILAGRAAEDSQSTALEQLTCKRLTENGRMENFTPIYTCTIKINIKSYGYSQVWDINIEKLLSTIVKSGYFFNYI